MTKLYLFTAIPHTEIAQHKVYMTMTAGQKAKTAKKKDSRQVVVVADAARIAQLRTEYDPADWHVVVKRWKGQKNNIYKHKRAFNKRGA